MTIGILIGLATAGYLILRDIHSDPAESIGAIALLTGIGGLIGLMVEGLASLAS